MSYWSVMQHRTQAQTAPKDYTSLFLGGILLGLVVVVLGLVLMVGQSRARAPFALGQVQKVHGAIQPMNSPSPQNNLNAGGTKSSAAN